VSPVSAAIVEQVPYNTQRNLPDVRVQLQQTGRELLLRDFPAFSLINNLFVSLSVPDDKPDEACNLSVTTNC